MRKRDGEFIVPSSVCHTFLRKQNLQLHCTQDILMAVGEKKKVKDKSNLLLINKLKIEANTKADKLGKI